MRITFNPFHEPDPALLLLVFNVSPAWQAFACPEQQGRPSICGANTQNSDITEQRGALAAVKMAKQVLLYHNMHF